MLKFMFGIAKVYALGVVDSSPFSQVMLHCQGLTAAAVCMPMSKLGVWDDFCFVFFVLLIFIWIAL